MSHARAARLLLSLETAMFTRAFWRVGIFPCRAYMPWTSAAPAPPHLKVSVTTSPQGSALHTILLSSLLFLLFLLPSESFVCVPSYAVLIFSPANSVYKLNNLLCNFSSQRKMLKTDELLNNAECNVHTKTHWLVLFGHLDIEVSGWRIRSCVLGAAWIKEISGGGWGIGCFGSKLDQRDQWWRIRSQIFWEQHGSNLYPVFSVFWVQLDVHY